MTNNHFGNHSIPCAQCGYDLRATPIGGSCPECGLRFIASRNGLRAEGEYVVVRSEVILPDRCIKTNTTDELEAVNKTLYWAHPAYFLFILVNLVVLLIVYMLVRKKCQITYCLSKSARRQIRQRVVLATGALALMVILGLLICSVNPVFGVILLIVTIIVGVVVISNIAMPLRIKKARNGEFWIKGCCAEFVEAIRIETTELPALIPPRNPVPQNNQP